MAKNPFAAFNAARKGGKPGALAAGKVAAQGATPPAMANLHAPPKARSGHNVIGTKKLGGKRKG